MVHGSREATIAAGIPQVLRYADTCGADEVYLVLFDRAKGKTWDKKVFYETRVAEGVSVTVFGM